ncbi:MAG: hypothetical protein R3321_04590, partial [Nitrososphaeraceae archaeon]|nr:hypothetical protein [Nitrososphaeraceae archaeon]
MDKLKLNITDDENFQLIVSEPYYADYKGNILYTKSFTELLDTHIEAQLIGVISGYKTQSIDDIDDTELLTIAIPPIPSELNSFRQDLCNSYVAYIIKSCELDLTIDNISIFYPNNSIT